MSKRPQWTTNDDWHWDNDRKRFVCMRRGPTYSWSLKKDQYVYHNKNMMDAIELCLENMDTFPDAEKIINRLEK